MLQAAAGTGALPQRCAPAMVHHPLRERDMYLNAKRRIRLWAWRLLVMTPLTLLFLAVALILPLTFLGFFGHDWLARNPINSWVLGALIYATTCYILSTSPGIIRIGERLLAVDLRMRLAIAGHGGAES
jgi:hypothetical protein